MLWARGSLNCFVFDGNLPVLSASQKWIWIFTVSHHRRTLFNVSFAHDDCATESLELACSTCSTHENTSIDCYVGEESGNWTMSTQHSFLNVKLFSRVRTKMLAVMTRNKITKRRNCAMCRLRHRRSCSSHYWSQICEAWTYIAE